MARETIAGVKREHRKVLNIARLSQEAAIDRLVATQRKVETELSTQISNQGETIRSLREELKTESARLLNEQGNHSITEMALRAARDRIANLQGALTHATQVMHELGRRTEG